MTTQVELNPVSIHGVYSHLHVFSSWKKQYTLFQIYNLAYFATDSEIKILTQKFLKKLSSPHAVHRRCAVQCVIGVCINSKKPSIRSQQCTRKYASTSTASPC
uniref:Uncharacterized protein n=1 Tax=Cacopsylla melanoneura TaxID=428564 RepID=A0A8D9AW62_9HEMI